MLWTIAVILVILWLLGFLAFHVGGGLIHILLVLAVIVIIWQLVTGRRSVGPFDFIPSRRLRRHGRGDRRCRSASSSSSSS
jgi:hypothetical protein